MDLNTLSVVVRNLVLPAGVLVLTTGIVWLIPRRWRVMGGLLLIIVAIIEYGYFFNKYQPFSPAKFVFPEHPVFEYLQREAGFNRYYGVDTAYIDNNFATFFRVFAPEGYDPLYIKRYGEFLGSSQKGEVPDNISRSDAFVGKENNPRRERIFDLLGIKYIVDKADDQAKEERDKELFPESMYNLAWRHSKWKIYERKSVLPRAFLVDSYVVKTGKEEIIKTFFDPNISPEKTLILEEKPNILPKPGGKGVTEITSYSPNMVRINVQTDESKLLFLSDSFYPGWEATLDGQREPIYRANYAFRAVTVPAGNHKVEFSYDPAVFKVGTVISLICLSLWLWGMVYFKK